MKKNGCNELPTHSLGGGTSKKQPPQTLRLLKRQLDINPRLTAKQLKKENPKLLSTTSIRTIQRRLHDDIGYKKLEAKRKPLVTEKQRKKRLEFAKKYKGRTADDWKKVMFTDESYFYVGDSAGQKV